MESLHLRETAGLAAAAAAAFLVDTTVLLHRKNTHDSIDFTSEVAEQGFRLAAAPMADAKVWPMVHLIHHSMTDANLGPFIELADAIDKLEGKVKIPDTIDGLDPVLLTNFDTNKAYIIGELGRALVRGKYQPPEHYPTQEIDRIFYGTEEEPRYFYEDNKALKYGIKHPLQFDPNNPPPLDAIRFMLRDPHAPALHRQGIPGVLWHNPTLYSYAEQNFRDKQLRPDNLQPDNFDIWARENRKNIRLAYVAGMALSHMALSKPKSAEEAAFSAVSGAAASGLAVLALLFGGNVTNGLGHAGDISRLTLGEFWDGKVYPKADGTYTTNSRTSKLIRILGPETFDEVRGQEIHHAYPNRIAYTDEASLPAQLREAPFGKSLEFLAKRRILLKPGSNFNGARLEDRPDVLCPAVVQIYKDRREALTLAA